MIFLRIAIIVILVFIPFYIFAQEESATEINMDDLRRRITGEARQELMSVSLGSSDVSLFATGSWKGDLQLNFGLSNSPLGVGFAAPQTPFLYQQEVDLTLSLRINNRWFVEANFVDDSAQNTYRAGYQGKPGEFLQYAGIGNAGLDFPAFPYLDLGGDSPSSFGFYGRFETNNIDIHTLVRYDAASREERTFSGDRERTYSDLQPQNTIRGISFVLPDTDINPDITIYIEDDKGALRDSTGRRWRLAPQSEYAFSRTQGLLELSIRPTGMIAVYYSKEGDNTPWQNSMGNYGGAGGFLAGVQQWFDPTRSVIKLENYPQCGNGSSVPGEIIIGGGRALVIYQPGAFSPFEKRNRYDSPSSAAEKAALVSLSSGSEISGFELALLENTAVIDDTLFSGIVSEIGVYELVSADAFNLRDPQARWPLAAKYPEIYLPSSGVFSGDIVIRFTNFSAKSGYFIGTDVIPGSVQVWRSGIQYSDFNYNQSSGEVAINGSVGQNEIIRITYLKKSEGNRLGSISAGLGAVYQNSANMFLAQAAVGVRWNIAEDSFTEENNSSAGNVGISAKTEWEYGNFNAKITGGFAFVQTDTTGLYRAAGMEGNEAIVPLAPETSFVSNPPSSLIAGNADLDLNNRAELIYRNYSNNSILGNNLMYLDWDASVVSGLDKPYPVKDRQLGDTQVLTAEFDLDTDNWTGFQVPVYNDSGLLSRSREIEIPFRFYGFNQAPSEKFKVIIQIGSLSGKDFAFNENMDLIWEKILFTDDWTGIPTDSYTSTNFDYNARIARFTLNDEDRQKLGDVKYLRIIIVNEGSSGISGRFLLAPPIARGAAFRAVAYNALTESIIGNTENISIIETIDSGINSLGSVYKETINKLHPNDAAQRVLKLEWENMQTGVCAGFDGRVGELPLADYRELSFFIKTDKPRVNETLKFIAAEGPDSLYNYQLNVEIPLSAFAAGQWSKVTIRYQGINAGVTVNGKSVSAPINYKPKILLQDDQGRRTSYIVVLISPDSGGTLDDGTIYIDEIILEDSIMYYRMNAGTAIEYKKEGTIIAAGNIPVLSDFHISTAVESEGRAQGESEENDFTGSLINRTGAGISVFGVKISGNIAFTAAEDTFLWSADHSLSRTIGPFSVKETFYASPWDNNARHNFNLAVSSYFSAKFEADALIDSSRLRQKWNLGLGYTPQNEFYPSASINTQMLWTRNNIAAEMNNYGKFWLESWETLLPDAGTGADARKMQAQIILTQRTKPVGAVISLEGNTNSMGVNNSTQSGNSLFLDIPLAFKKTGINFRMGRGFKRHLYFYGQDAADDGRKFFESIEDFFPVWTVFPGYSLFAEELEDVIKSTLDDSPSAQSAYYSFFNDHFSAKINLPLIYNLSAFFIPNKITFLIERTLEQKMDTLTDKLNYGASLGYYAINMFGNMGYHPFFKFYQTDEYSHSIDASVYIPKGEDISFRVQSVLSAGFRGAGGGLLNFVNTFTIRSEGYWLESFISSWEAPVNKNLLILFYDWFVSTLKKQKSFLGLSSLLNSKYEKLRKETLESVFDKQTDYMRWSIIAGHEEIIRIQGKLNFSTFFKLRCGEDKERDTLIFDVILGTSLRVSF
ncbi:hypothetical protein R84B8_02660 [Treponema sp. R8-4-B8]